MGDLQPWEFQEEKANVCMRYTKTQSLYLSRKGVLPEIVDLFGMAVDESVTAMEEQAEAEEPVDQPDEEQATEGEAEPEAQEEPRAIDDDEDDIDSFFG